MFNQFDVVQVLQVGKHNTGQPASFAEGDWNSDGFFTQLDVIAALQTGQYTQFIWRALTLPYDAPRY